MTGEAISDYRTARRWRLLNPRLRGGGGCPCGGEKPSTNENREFTNGRRAIRAFVKNSWMVSQCGVTSGWGRVSAQGIITIIEKEFIHVGANGSQIRCGSE